MGRTLSLSFHPQKEFHHDKVSPYKPNLRLLFLKLNRRVCYECLAQPTLLYCVTLWQTSVLVPSSPTPRVSRIIRLLLWMTWSVKWFAFKPWITLAKFPVIVWEEEIKKKEVDISLRLNKTLFFFLSSFFFFPLSVLGYRLACWPFLLPCPCPYMNCISKTSSFYSQKRHSVIYILFIHSSVCLSVLYFWCFLPDLSPWG